MKMVEMEKGFVILWIKRKEWNGVTKEKGCTLKNYKIYENKNEKYSQNEEEVNHWSAIDDIRQIIPHFPAKPFTSFCKDFAMPNNKHIAGTRCEKKLLSW